MNQTTRLNPATQIPGNGKTGASHVCVRQPSEYTGMSNKRVAEETLTVTGERGDAHLAAGDNISAARLKARSELYSFLKSEHNNE